MEISDDVPVIVNKPLNTRDIQSVSLEILKDVHCFCASNNLRYSLAYGTLIGAVRHKGFIPWDDDIDILMPRPDYDRFCKEFKASGRMIVSEFDSDCYINYCKVFDTEKTTCNTLAPFNSMTKGGVSIDVFPADSVPDNHNEFVALVRNLYPHWRRQFRYRLSMASVSTIVRTFQLKDVFILLAVKFSFLGRYLLRKENRIIRETISRIGWGTTNHWSQITFLDDGAKNYQQLESFSGIIEMPFEDQQFYVMQGYDTFLKNLYGDYMKLPPEKDRIPKHKQTTYYWIK